MTFTDINSKEELQEVISRTPVTILICLVQGRDAVNAQYSEEFEDAAEANTNDKRTFAKIYGDTFRAELKELGVEMGDTPYPKFVVLGQGKARTVEDVTDVDLSGMIKKYGKP